MLRKSILPPRLWIIPRSFSFAQDFDTTKDYYKILGVTNTTEKKEIKKAFAALAKKYHPDKSKGTASLF